MEQNSQEKSERIMGACTIGGALIGGILFGILLGPVVAPLGATVGAIVGLVVSTVVLSAKDVAEHLMKSDNTNPDQSNNSRSLNQFYQNGQAVLNNYQNNRSTQTAQEAQQPQSEEQSSNNHLNEPS